MIKPDLPTLEDVARLAGVSTASVSRALNDPDKVAEPTRKKIESAIEDLGYTPNFGGRVLASNRTNTVGAIIPTLANAIFATGMQAFGEELSKAGRTLLIATTHYDPDEEYRQVRSLLAQGADALLLIGEDRPAATRRLLQVRKVPHVVSWIYGNDDDQTYVGFDNYAAAQMVAGKVLDLGHRNIAMLTGITTGNDRARNRSKGIADAIAAYGDGARLSHSVEVKFRVQYGKTGLDEILNAAPDTTAVLCGNDVLAAGAMVRAREMGREVPRDLSIVGFDDIGLASVVTPPLTTVRVPQIEMGRMAAQALLAKMDGGTGDMSRKLPTHWVERGSLGPPPK